LATWPASSPARSMPALLVDGVIKAAGSVPPKKDIAAWLA
jgi:hypothetical protein